MNRISRWRVALSRLLHGRPGDYPSKSPSHRSPPPLRPTLADNKESHVVRIDLTTEQKEQVKAATEKSVDAIELTVQELEARIAPIALIE